MAFIKKKNTMRIILAMCFMLLGYQAAFSQCSGFTVDIVQTQFVTCWGGFDGALSSTVSGGTMPYTYLWSTSTGNYTTPSVSGIGFGGYLLTVTDANSCIATDYQYVAQPNTPINISIDNTTDANCAACNGTANITANGGFGGLTFQWSDGSTAEDRTNLCQGTYSVVATDATGCTQVNNLTIGNSNTLGIGSVAVTGVAGCLGNCDGSATASASGGTTPYFYIWSNGATGATASGLCPGTNAVSVTDANGCIFGQLVVINQSFITSQIVNSTDATCGQANGVATITGVGGMLPYTYVWSNGETGPSASNLLPNVNYIVTVSDAVGCPFTMDVIVFDSNDLSIGSVAVNNDVSCGSTNDGSASVLGITGGTAPYTALWSNGETTLTAVNLEAGNPTVTVTGANGCVATGSVTIIDAAVDYTITTTLTSCNTSDGTAEVVFNQPVTNPVYNWSNGANTQQVNGLAEGWYSVTVEDITSGCRSKKLLEIEEDPTCIVTIEGYVFLDDVTPDCVQDAGTTPLDQKLLVLSNGTDSTYAYTDATGYYSFEAEAGNYTVRLAEIPFHELACAGSYTNAINAPTLQTTYQGGDFYLKYTPYIDVRTYTNAGAARPGFTRTYNVYYCNNGSEPESGTVTLVHDEAMTNFNGFGMEDSYDPLTRTVVWSYSNLQPGACAYELVKFTVDVSTPLGAQVCDTSYVTPLAGDYVPSNNEFSLCRVTSGSFDPNDKQNLAGRDPFGGDVYAEDNPFLYQIRFQNTGTDTAFTVVIRDTLDATKLDIESINFIDASHNYTAQFTDNNILEFWFENIMLPDSNVNEAASHGFVLFSIDQQPNLPVGATIENSAAIYFDFNAPVITNTVVNTLALPPSTIWSPVVNTISLTAFPNPSDAFVLLDLQLERNGETEVFVYSNTGRLMAHHASWGQFSEGQHQLAVSTAGLVDGVYFVKVQSGEDIGVVKVTVIH